MARATLGKLCQISLLPLKNNNNNTSSEINTINLLNFILMSPKTHVQYATDTGESCMMTMTTMMTQMMADEEGCSLLSLVHLEKRRPW
jgi:hypothetical protein